MLLCATLALVTAGSSGTIITFEDQPGYVLPTPESLFFRQYASLGLTNINSSAAGAYLLKFPSLLPTRTFVPPHSGWQAAWIHAAGAPLPPTQKLEFSGGQQTVSVWLAAATPVTISCVVSGSGPTPLQTFNQALAANTWTQVTINAPGGGQLIRAIQMTSTDGQGAYRYTDWAIDDLSFTGPAQACGASDVGSAGGTDGADGQLNNNDFVVFIDRFFAHDHRADVGVTGGVPGSDMAFDNNDFVVFIDQFFAGCP
jgi:hypothetical protein